MRQRRLRAGLHRPANAILDLLGRMRLTQQLAEEELREAPPVAQIVVPVVFGPALVCVEYLIEVIDGPVSRQRRQVRYPGGDGHHAEDTVWMQGGGEQRNPAAAADPTTTARS